MNIADKLIKVTENEAEIHELNEKLKQRVNGGKADAKSWYDEFWDAFQDYGKRTDYIAGFGGFGWTDDLFKPKYNITVSNADNMFNAARKLTNVAELLRKAGVELDTSNCVSFSNCFNSASNITELPFLDVSKATGMYSLAATFSYTNCLHTLHIKSSSETLFTSTTFNRMIELTNLTIDGVIAKGAIDLKDSTKLSADSLKSIINALSNTTTGLTITLPKTAQANYEAVYGAGSWATLTASRSNWTIVYA